MRNGWDAITALECCCNGHRTWAHALGGTLEDTLRNLAVDNLGAVGGDIDICWVELNELIQRLENLFDTLASNGWQHLD